MADAREDLAAMIARLVDERVDARLAELGRHSDVYDADHLPPATSRAAFMRWAKEIPGVEPTPRGYAVPKAAWEKFWAERLELRRRHKREVKVDAPANVIELATAMLSGATRATRR